MEDAVYDRSALNNALAGLDFHPEAWNSARFRLVTILQEAPRNHGHIELLEETDLSRQVRLLAAKVMPLWWTCESQVDFLSKYPDEQEFPWRDICLTRYLWNAVGPGCVCELVGLFRRTGSSTGTLPMSGTCYGKEIQDEEPTKDDEDKLCLVTSYCCGADVFTWLERSLNVLDDREAAVKPMMLRVLEIMYDIHSVGVAHGDLSLENVMFAEEPVDGEPLALRVIDFGAGSSSIARGVRGKPSYQAPEMHLVPEYNAFAADVFSLGVMIFILVVGNYPWQSTRPYACRYYRFSAEKGFEAFLERRKIRRQDQLLSLSQVLSPSVISLLGGMLCSDPQKRMTLPAALQHSWFQE
mmetsp:Transcript_106237/g.188885  ORF Transcript_106237/g.188885 Transcript_106237/m.188885 type:complete len:354 (-) Transcript_106237:175-1236(-)